MTRFNYLFILLLLLISTQCSEEATDVQGEIIIKYGMECGWCAGQEYLTVTKTKIIYQRIIPCGENEGTSTDEKVMDPFTWEVLKSSFDHSLFLTLEYNECNVCVDGCDEIIEITDDESVHMIRYTPSEEVVEVQQLREFLEEMMEEMREEG